MIATLTNIGCLKLHVPQFNCWIEIADLSMLWVDHCNTQWKDADALENLENLQTRVSQLKINVMLWDKNIVEDEKDSHSYFATMTYSGTLALWNVPHLPDFSTLSEPHKPSLITTCETHLCCVTVLHWMWWNKKKFSIAAGNKDGCIIIVTFSIKDDKITFINIKDIWNSKDRMQVSCIRSLAASSIYAEDYRLLGVSKNDFFLVLLVCEDGIRASCHELVGSLTITGIEVMNEKTFLVTTLPGYIGLYTVKVDKTLEHPQLSLETKAIKTNVSWQYMSCFGVSKNPFTNLWALGTSNCKLFDHLVIRRPSQIVLFSLKDLSDPISQLFDCTTSLRHVWECLEIMRLDYVRHQEPPPLPYLKCPDELEALSTTQLQLALWQARVVMAILAAGNPSARQPETSAYVTLLEELILCRYACNHIQILTARHEQQSLDEKIIASLALWRAWLKVWSLQYANSVDEKSNEVQKEEAPLSENSVDNKVVSLEKTYSSNISHFDDCAIAESTEPSEGVVDMDETSSSSDSNSVSSEKSMIKGGQLQLPRGSSKIPSNFLKARLSATRKEVNQVLALPMVSGAPEKELCDFCQQEVQMDVDWRWGVCQAGHRLARCCLCLCRCRAMPQSHCLVCPVVACKEAGDPTHSTDHGHRSYCIFCDSPLLIDEKFRPHPAFKSPCTEREPSKDGVESNSEAAAEDEPMEFDA